MNRPKFLFYSLSFLVLGAGIVWAGTTTLTTYYPAPTGNYNQITSNYVSIGTSTMGQALVVMPAAGENGNVGIGVTSPQAPLDVRYLHASTGWVSNAIIFGSDTYYMGRLGEDTNTNGIWLANTYSSSAYVDFRLATAAHPDVTNSNTSVMRIITSGNVGIGTTAPVAHLDISLPADNSVGLRVNDASGYGIYTNAENTLNFNYGHNSADIGYINYLGYLGGATQFRTLEIDNGKQGQIASFVGSTGNVGIGTTNPGAALDVDVTSNFNGIHVGDGTQAPGIQWLTNNASGYNWMISTNKESLGALNFSVAASAGSAGNPTSNGSVMSILNNGNVGIGNTSPGSKLEVQGSEIRFTEPGHVGIISFYPGTSLNQITSNYYSGSDIPLVLGTWANRANQLYLSTSGYVGIGNTSPGADLSFPNLTGSSNADGITWYSPTPTTYGIYKTAGAWSGPNYQQLELSWTTGIVIDGGSAYGKSGTILQPNGGNVGIGTTAPQALLEVYQGAAGGNTLQLDKNGGAALTFSRAGTLDWLIEDDTAADSDLGVYNWNGSSWSNLVNIKNNGYVGIATTVPGSILDIATSGSSGGPRTVNIRDSSQGDLNFGGYPGAWTAALAIQNNNNSRYIWMNPLATT